jgi:diaminobutyrate-2-oxoglutarate transaminase
MDIEIFAQAESNVRYYCRHFPVVFARAKNELIWDVAGTKYIDFLSAAGSLNYGHNHPAIKHRLLDYISGDFIAQAIDMHTTAKAEFIGEFMQLVKATHALRYRLMFTGPTGTNAVEAAMKLARKVTGRSNIAAFTNAFHGVSLGSLAATGSASKRRAGGIPLDGVDRYPYDGYFGSGIDTVAMIERYLSDPGSGYDVPAAFILETVQGEGGLNVASDRWLHDLAALCRRRDILLIVDDIQAGCGRCGPFFSYGDAGIEPDIVCLSKSLSGYGLPMSMLMIREEIDHWEPGEHNGTFRGNNHAFVAASAALQVRKDAEFHHNRSDIEVVLDAWVDEIAATFPTLHPRGKGLMRGLQMPSGAIASEVCRQAFDRHVILETSGPHGEVVKFMPALTMRPAVMREGLEAIAQAIECAVDPILGPAAKPTSRVKTLLGKDQRAAEHRAPLVVDAEGAKP